MFCTQCGRLLREGAKFCPECGHPLPGAAPQGMTVPVNLNTGLIATEPYILRLERDGCGLIRIGPELYADITRSSVRDRDRENAFRVYAFTLNSKSAGELLASFPGSTGFSNSRILSFHIDTYYDSDRHRYADYDRFVLKTDAARYRGSVGGDFNILSRKDILLQLLGSRFTSREYVHGFDS